jgi:transcription elongation factor Elf1
MNKDEEKCFSLGGHNYCEPVLVKSVTIGIEVNNKYVVVCKSCGKRLGIEYEV